MRRRVKAALRAFHKRVLRAPILSPAGLAARAAALALAYSLLHLAGLREYASFLSGTAPTGDPKDLVALTLGVTYVLAYLAFVLLTPVLLIAAGVFLGLERILLRVRHGPGGTVSVAEEDAPARKAPPGTDGAPAA